MGKVLNPSIGVQSMFGNRCRKEEAFQAPASAQGHIDLTVGKGCPGINNRLFKAQSLALVDGNGPGWLEGIMFKSADDLTFNLFAFRIYLIGNIFPDLWIDSDSF